METRSRKRAEALTSSALPGAPTRADKRARVSSAATAPSATTPTTATRSHAATLSGSMDGNKEPSASSCGGRNPSVNEEIIQRLNNMEARLNANGAKFCNYTIHDYVGREVPYYAVVKYTPGHPWEHPPAVQNVQVATEYLVNTPPPDNLLPLNHDQLNRMTDGLDNPLALDATRQRMRAIYWFYNDPILFLAADADRFACSRWVRALYGFLKYPETGMVDSRY